jgi:hypothetical protein
MDETFSTLIYLFKILREKYDFNPEIVITDFELHYEVF